MTTPTTNDIEHLILLIAREPSIPSETRASFLEHIKAEGLDETALNFIEQHLDRLQKRSEEGLNYAAYKQALYDRAIKAEQIPQISGKKYITDTALGEMETILNTFKNDYKEHQMSLFQEEEASEEADNQELIANLKGNL